MQSPKKTIFITIALLFTVFATVYSLSKSSAVNNRSSGIVVPPQTESCVTTREITDMAGRKVIIPCNISRICSNGTAQGQLMLFLGASKKIVATLPSVQANSWIIKIFPEIKELPTPFVSSSVNIEELINAKPDLVTLWSGTEDIQKKLDEVKIPYALVYYSNAEEFKKGITLMGNILGEKESGVAEKFIAYYDSNIDKVGLKTKNLALENKKRVYYVTDTPLDTEGRNSIATSWIEAAGGINVAAEGGVDELSAKVSMESILEWDPEFIVIRDAKNKDAIINDEKWKNITAVKSNNVYVVPKGVNVWSARSADGALQILWSAKLLHPELFSDIDIESETRSFYEDYYHYKLNDEELNEILNPQN
jgi:iron complex transport system substrate-binding protein